MSENYKARIGKMIQSQRQARNLTQQQLAEQLGTSQSAINRIEKGNQNISLEMLARISEVLSSDIISLNSGGKTNFRVNGGRRLSGEITIKPSKNAAVGLLCASLLNSGKTVFRNMARIEEVNRIIEVLSSIGVRTRWLNDRGDLEINPPKRLKLDQIDAVAAKKTRSIIMFLGPLLHQYREFRIPYAGGCNLGKRTVEPHLAGLRHFGLTVDAVCGADFYQAHARSQSPRETIVLTERGDTVTENVLMAAALHDGETTIRNASANYAVQDLCFYLEKMGVKIDGIGTTVLKIRGQKQINKTVEYHVSEDPIEAMSFVAAAVVTDSEITLRRVPIEFVEVELANLTEMNLQFDKSAEYKSGNGRTRLVDLTVRRSPQLTAPEIALKPMPFPGINMDNLPFLGLIATAATGRTLVHDWAYENRAIYFTELSKLGANVELVDPHRVYITGPTKWRAADLVAPPALRPSVVVMLAMLAAPGVSILRDVYNIKRGYEDFAERLNSLGADITTINEL
ncbi:MAG: UDP-N-acetylglucosamine 1-carboxyvinyltransferase [Candidatus Nomurabacteria bacterium]|jgi:UDP-N-acetylglucosamine 1-carboxyvinyltransferase|nr:UDP-N-acetylglucosamine 1-carboxyvinyltransferase [Candidatus Nomurabacteria bacterium]